MSRIDYLKVIDLMARTLKLDQHVDVSNPEKEFNIFAVEMKGINEDVKHCKLVVRDFDMDLIFKKIYFTESEFEKFTSKFEYDLEQTFFKNIEMDFDEDVVNYKVTIKF